MKSSIALIITVILILAVDYNYSPRYKLMLFDSGKCSLDKRFLNQKYYFIEPERMLEHQPDRSVLKGYDVQGFLAKNYKSEKSLYLDENVILDSFYFERSSSISEYLVGIQDSNVYIIRFHGKKYIIFDDIFSC